MTTPRANGATNQAAQPDTSIYITRFANFTEHDGELQRYPTWNAFFKVLKDSMEHDGDQLPVWSPSTFAGNFRREHDIQRVGGMVLRYPAGQRDSREAFEFWSEEAFGNATLCFAYKTDQSVLPSFRVVIPFGEPITREEFAAVSTAIVEMARKHGHDVNAASQDPAGTWEWTTSRAQCLGPREGSRLLNPSSLVPEVLKSAAPIARDSSRATPTSFSLEKWLSEVRASAPDDAGRPPPPAPRAAPTRA